MTNLETGKTYLRADGGRFTALSINDADRTQCSDGTWRNANDGKANDPNMNAVARIDDIPTLRDKFAMAALTGFCAQIQVGQNRDDFSDEVWAIADSMLNRREKNDG